MRHPLSNSLEAQIERLLEQLREEKAEPPRWAECLPAEESAHFRRRIGVLDEQIEELCYERARLVGETCAMNEAFRRHLASCPPGLLDAEATAASHDPIDMSKRTRLPKWLPRSSTTQ